MRYWLGIDQGSSSTKGLLVDEEGAVIGRWQVPVSTQFLNGLRVEQNPEELLTSVEKIIAEAKAKVDVISSLGLSVQRSGVMAWTAHKVLHPLITWRDQRFTAVTEALATKREEIFSETGVFPLPAYAAPKIAFLQRSFPEPEVRVGTLESFLIDRLTGSDNFFAEESIAARTLLYSLQTRKWSEAMCKLFEVEAARLATLKRSQDSFGAVFGVPLKAVVGDQQAALYSLGDNVMINLGTLAAVGVPTGKTPPSTKSFLRSVFYSSGSGAYYLVEASTPAAGQLLDRVRTKRKFVAPDFIDDGLKTVLYSAIGGTGSPEYRPPVPTLIRDWNGRESDLDQAIIENIGNAVAANLQLLSREGFLGKRGGLMVSGGLAAIGALVGHIAAVSGMELSLVNDMEASAWGAALLASGGAIKRKLKVDSKVTPTASPGAKARFEVWNDLRQMALSGNFNKEFKFEF